MGIIKAKPLEIIINANSLKDRLDVSFYHPKFLEIENSLGSIPWGIKSIGEIAKKITKGETPLWRGDRYVDEGIPFLRVVNLREEGLETTNLVYIPKETHKRMKRSQLKDKDILYSMAGTIGIATVYEAESYWKEANINQAIARIELKEGYNPYYVAIFLNTKFGRLQAERFVCAIAQPNINFQQIKSIKIIFPPARIQEKIVELMKTAWKEKKKRLEKSNLLIATFDMWIKNELKVVLSEVKKTNSYLIDLEDNPRSRLDVKYNSPKFLQVLNAIENSPYEVKTLKQISKNIVSGQRPKGGVKYIEDGVPSIGGEHITSEGDFNFENIRFIPKEFHQQHKKSWVKPHDILIVKDGATTGKVAIVPKEFPFKECNINEHVFKIELKEGYNPYYVFSYLFSSLGQEQINRLISGAAQKGITRDAIESVRIIIPPLEIQNEIAVEIIKRQQESRRLKKEAEKVVEKAKKEVEKMIIGEI